DPANPSFRPRHTRDDRGKAEHLARLLACNEKVLRAQSKRDADPLAFGCGAPALTGERDTREPLQLPQQLKRPVAERLETLLCAHAVNRRARPGPFRSACPSTRASPGSRSRPGASPKCGPSPDPSR